MNTRIALSAAVLVTVANANAGSGTFASFFDKGTTVVTRVETGTDPNTGLGTAVLTASGTDYTLVTPGHNYEHVSFTLDAPLDLFTSGIDAVSGPGSFTFTQAGLSVPLLKINFVSSAFDDNGFHASFDDFSNGVHYDDEVRFSGWLIDNRLNVVDRQGFDFSLANELTDGATTTYSSAFSASGTYNAVPEPASMAALGMGALALLRRRRRA